MTPLGETHQSGNSGNRAIRDGRVPLIAFKNHKDKKHALRDVSNRKYCAKQCCSFR